MINNQRHHDQLFPISFCQNEMIFDNQNDLQALSQHDDIIDSDLDSESESGLDYKGDLNEDEAPFESSCD